MSLVQCLCCQVEVSATGLSLTQRSRTDCGVFECDQVKIKNILYSFCEKVGRRGKDYETKRRERKGNEKSIYLNINLYG
jgi:hypothetical protein